MERLRMNRICDIIYRLRRGQSERAIERDLGHSRNTIREYHRLAREKGYLDPDRSIPEPEEILAEIGHPPTPPVMESTVEPYREAVEKLLDKGVEMLTIHRRLVKNYGYTGSYSSVKRFVKKIRPKEKEVFIRIEVEPGKEAQVDFGGAGKQRDPKTGKWRQAYCFMMTLSHSRYPYGELVFDQRMETWIACHRRAFEWFGGTPKELVIDNLKAAVLVATLEDQKLSEPYRKLALHYDILIHPCRVRTPQHKGKVESGIHYVQRSFLAGEEFVDIDDANRRLRRWIVEEAGTREHGTTKEAPLARFLEIEKAALQPLPQEAFELMELCPAKVHRDCHVQVKGCYYHASEELVGKTLDVYVYESTVQLYDGLCLIVTYDRGKKGERKSREDLRPREKSEYLRKTREYCSGKAAWIGPGCREVVTILLSERPLDRLRSVQGILKLTEKYDRARVEAACARALWYGDPSLGRIKRILESGLDRVLVEPEVFQGKLAFYQYARNSEEFFGQVAPASGGTEGGGAC